MAALEKVLSFRSILLITINSIMGTGIFFLPAIGAAQIGTASFWAWVVMGIIAIYMSFIFAELVGMFPESGGVYEFCKQTFSPGTAFFVGFLTLITGYITIAMLVVGAVSYLAPNAPGWATTGIAIIIVALFHLIAYTGMRTSAVMLIAFSLITLVTVFMVLIPSILQFDPSKVSDIFVFCTAPGCRSYEVLFATVFLIAETYFGWETATFLAGETKDGAKIVPRALIISTLVIVALSWALVFFGFGSVGAAGLSEHLASPFTFMATSFYGAQFSAVASMLVYLAIIGAVAGWVVSAPRLISAMAADKLFISQLSAVHPRFKTPGRAIIFQAILTVILIVMSSSSYETLLHLLVPLVLLQYSMVVVALVVLRYKGRDLPRTFKIPGPGWLALWVIPVFGYLTYQWTIHTDGAVQILSLGASFLFVGFPIYLLLKVYYDPAFIIKLNDSFAWFVYLTEKFVLPREVVDEILLLAGDIHGKRVLEYGCSVGTFTVYIADKVSKYGKVYATNISKKELMISQKRIKRRGHEHVTFIHDEHQVNRVHPQIPQVDVVLSFGMLSAIQDVKKVLREMNSVMAQGGKICLVDYTNYFHIIPDVEWLTSDEKIKKIFRESGFSVTVTRHKGRLWDYIYIHGIKGSNKYTDIVYI